MKKIRLKKLQKEQMSSDIRIFCTGLTKENKTKVNQTKKSLVLKIWRGGAILDDPDPSLNPNLVIKPLQK